RPMVYVHVHGKARAQLAGVGQASRRLVRYQHAGRPGPLEEEREEGARGPLTDDRGILADDIERMAPQRVDDRAELLRHEQVGERGRGRQPDAGGARQRPSMAYGTVSTRSPGAKPGQRDSTTSPTLSCPGKPAAPGSGGVLRNTLCRSEPQM